MDASLHDLLLTALGGAAAGGGGWWLFSTLARTMPKPGEGNWAIDRTLWYRWAYDFLQQAAANKDLLSGKTPDAAKPTAS